MKYALLQKVNTVTDSVYIMATMISNLLLMR
jgi:hypothetical protein